MLRFVLSILLWSLSLVPALAQGSKISVTGQVRSGTKPVGGRGRPPPPPPPAVS